QRLAQQFHDEPRRARHVKAGHEVGELLVAFSRPAAAVEHAPVDRSIDREQHSLDALDEGEVFQFLPQDADTPALYGCSMKAHLSTSRTSLTMVWLPTSEDKALPALRQGRAPRSWS